MEYTIVAKNHENGREVTYTLKPDCVAIIDWDLKLQQIEDELQADKQF